MSEVFQGMRIVAGRDLRSDDHLADLQWDTDPHVFAMLFGDRAVWRAVFAAEWEAAFGCHQASETDVAMQDATPCGLVNSFAGATMVARYEQTYARWEAVLNPAQRHRLEAGFAAMDWLFPRVPDNALYILNIVVALGQRGRNIGRLLIEQAAAKARRLDLDTIHLDVASTNPAVDFYQRVGFRPVVETRVMGLPDGIDLSSHIRMEMVLS